MYSVVFTFSSKYVLSKKCRKFHRKQLTRRFQHKLFLMKFAKFLRTPFFKEHLRWLLLFYKSYRNIVVRNGKKHSHDKVSYLPILDLHLKQITIQEDNNIYTYSLFCLVVLDAIHMEVSPVRWAESPRWDLTSFKKTPIKI